MRRFRKVHMMVILVALVAALSALMVGPVGADRLSVECTGTIFNLASYTVVPDADGDGVILSGNGVCVVPLGDTVHTDVELSEGLLLLVLGTIDGSVFGTTDGSVFGVSLFVTAGGTVRGDITLNSDGFIAIGLFTSFVGVGRTKVAGSVVQLGNGGILLSSVRLGDKVKVNGDVINEGTGDTILQTPGPGTGGLGGGPIRVSGSVKAVGGGTHTAQILDTGSIRVGGEVCGGPPVGYDNAKVNDGVHNNC